MIVAYLRGTAAGDSVTRDRRRPARAARRCSTAKASAPPATIRDLPDGAAASDIGMLRRPLELEQSILDPGATLNANYRFARAVTKTGTVVTGRLLNQSTFSVQMLDSAEKLRAFDKPACASSPSSTRRPMPSSRGTLDTQEIADIVTYLTTLRGPR